MNKVTQSQLNAMIDEFKEGVNDELKQSGNSLAVEIAMGNKGILSSFVMYQDCVIPSAKEHGLTAPSLSELFGIEINLTCEEVE